MIIAVILCHCVSSALPSFVFGALSERFFISSPHPRPIVCESPPARCTNSTPTQPPGLLRALESNFLLIKFTIKGPLMPTSAAGFYFFSCSFSLIYRFFMRGTNSCLLTWSEFSWNWLLSQDRHKYGSGNKWRVHKWTHCRSLCQFILQNPAVNKCFLWSLLKN